MAIIALILLGGFVCPPMAGAGVHVSLSESIKSEVKSTVISQGFSTVSESTNSTNGKWKLEITLPFTTENWSSLDQGGTLSVRVGKQTLEKKFGAADGFIGASNTFRFNLTRPIVVGTGFKYITLPTDVPPSPAPAPGTKQIFGSGSLEFKRSQLKITLSSVGHWAPSLAGENFLSLGEGAFEGNLPIDVNIGGQNQHAELAIIGSIKRKDISRGDMNGSIVQISLSGKA